MLESNAELYPAIRAFKETVPLIGLIFNLPLIKEIQELLKEGGFYTGKIDGILGEDTINAFRNFKQAAYLEFPDQIGSTTAKALLELVGQAKHSPPQEATQASVKVLKGISFRLPGKEIVYCDQAIGKCPNFTWGEATKNGSRVPFDKQAVQRIIELAEYMELVRAIFDGRVITITSWYRPPEVNRQQGGVSNSRHLVGDAVDFLVSGIPPRDVYRRLNNWHGARGGLGNSSAFTHLDRRGYCARFSYG